MGPLQRMLLVSIDMLIGITIHLLLPDHCYPDYIIARQIENIVTIPETTGEYWVKTHPQYPVKGFSSNQDCYMSFMTRTADITQEISFQVVRSSLQGDSFLAFGNDYGDLERC